MRNINQKRKLGRDAGNDLRRLTTLGAGFDIDVEYPF